MDFKISQNISPKVPCTLNPSVILMVKMTKLYWKTIEHLLSVFMSQNKVLLP